MNDIPITNRFYRHYKGGLYQVVGIAQHTENFDDTLVIYRHVGGKLYARPLSVWLSPAKVTGPDVFNFSDQTVKVPRFQIIPEDFKLSLPV